MVTMYQALAKSILTFAFLLILTACSTLTKAPEGELMSWHQAFIKSEDCEATQYLWSIKRRCGTFHFQPDEQSPVFTMPFQIYIPEFVEYDDELVVVIPGGPGQRLLESDENTYWAWSPWLFNDSWAQPLVLLEPLGTGGASPRPDCHNEQEFYDLADKNIDTGAYFYKWHKLMGECNRNLENNGLPTLADYDSILVLQSYLAFIDALNIDKTHLVGVSNGTRVAMNIAKYIPRKIKSMVLDSVVTADYRSNRDIPERYENLFTLYDTACKLHPSCATEKHPLVEKIKALYWRLQFSPQEIVIFDGYLQRSYPVKIDGRSFLNLIFSALYDGEMRSSAILAINKAFLGKYDRLEMLMERLYSTDYGISGSMFYALDCYESYHADGWSEAENLKRFSPIVFDLLSDGIGFNYCKHIGNKRAPDWYFSPYETNIPVLILSGRFDPITLSEDALKVAESLPNGRALFFPHASHSLLTSDNCAVDMTVRFLNAPNKPIQATESCVNFNGEGFGLQ